MNNRYLTFKQKKLNQLLHVSNNLLYQFLCTIHIAGIITKQKPLCFSSEITGTVCNNADTDTNNNNNKVIETDCMYCIFAYVTASCQNAASYINA